jgi:hypothetical protein
MTQAEEQEWQRFFDFVREVVGDSPHQCDSETMEWFYNHMQAIEEIVFDA